MFEKISFYSLSVTVNLENHSPSDAYKNHLGCTVSLQIVKQ